MVNLLFKLHAIHIGLNLIVNVIRDYDLTIKIQHEMVNIQDWVVVKLITVEVYILDWVIKVVKVIIVTVYKQGIKFKQFTTKVSMLLKVTVVV